MDALNFDDVAEAQGSDYVLPGTKGIFSISDVEHGESSQKGTPFIKMKFTDENGSSFSQSFYLTQNALSRVQHLWKHSHGGEELSGSVTVEGLIAGFNSRKVALKVSGTIGNNGKTYADLSFGGFAAAPSQEGVDSLEFTANETADIEAALANKANQSVSNADAETETLATNEADAF